MDKDTMTADLTMDMCIDVTRAKFSEGVDVAALPVPSVAPKSKQALLEETTAIYRRLCAITQDFDVLDLAVMQTILRFVTEYPGKAHLGEKHFRLIGAFKDKPSEPPPAAKVYDFPAPPRRSAKPKHPPASH